MSVAHVPPLRVRRGDLVCIVCSSRHSISPVRKEEDVEKVLKVQLAASAVLTVLLYPLAHSSSRLFCIGSGAAAVTCDPVKAYLCVPACGPAASCFITEYYTSHSYEPCAVARSCKTGAATNIIYGLALGYKSLILPILLLAITVFIAFTFAGMYGAQLGMLRCLSIDVPRVRQRRRHRRDDLLRPPADALDAAGNTTAAGSRASHFCLPRAHSLVPS